VLAFVAALIAIPALTTRAQYSGALGSSWNNPVSAGISRIIVDRINQRMLAKRLAAKRGQPSKPASIPAESEPAAARPSGDRINAAVRFRSSGSRVKVGAIVSAIGGTPDTQAQLTAYFNQLLDTFDAAASADGYRNDVALAFSAFIALNSTAYHGGALPPDAKVIEIRDIVAEGVAGNDAFVKLTDRQKQEMYEILVVFGSLAYNGFAQAQQANDAEAAGIYRELARANLKTVLGIEAEQVKFTTDGLNIDIPNSQQPAASVQPQAAAQPAMHAGELVKAFEENEIRANQLFVGKRVRIYGSVNSIETEGQNAVLTFRSTITTYAMARCVFSKAQSGGLARLRINDEAMVEGTVRGWEGGAWGAKRVFVVVENCRVP
jgi:hypothetical protein